MTLKGLTSQQERIMELLLDGAAHPWKDIVAKCMDEYSNAQSVAIHISNLRKILREGAYGIDIMGIEKHGEGGNGCSYQVVVPYRGRRFRVQQTVDSEK